MNTLITPEQFSLSMKKLGVDETRPKIAVAVSGGGDSLALALLIQEWVGARGGEMLALTVDHQLRAESAREAEGVQKLLRARGIAHEILKWEGKKPPARIQEKAREARYALLLKACRDRGFPVLAVAHNIEDRIETFWMRLSHGSGLDGLAGMAAARKEKGATIIRPVMNFTRAQLRATCAHHGIEWIEDPSNKNEKYLRVKLRAFEEMLAGEGLTPQRLSQTLQKLEDARAALQDMTDEALRACVLFPPEGYAVLKTSAWKKYPRELQRRILSRTLMIVSGEEYPAGHDAVEQLRMDMEDSGFSGKTLSGCEIFPSRGDILMTREAAAVEGRVAVKEGTVWDGRFIFSNFPNESLEVGFLGEIGLSELRKNMKEHGDLPFKVKCVLPALWRGENLVAVPHLGYYDPNFPALKSGRIVKIV